MGEPQRVTCRATSKQSGKRCGNPPAKLLRADGTRCTLCGYHGAKTEGVSCEANVTHGGRRRFIPVDQIAEAGPIAEALAHIEERKALLLANTAVETVHAGKVSDLEMRLKIHDSTRKNLDSVLKIDELERATAAPAGPTIVLGDLARVVLVPVRDGHARAMKHPDDASIYLVEDKATGAWSPGRSAMVDGYEQFEPVLQLSKGTP